MPDIKSPEEYLRLAYEVASRSKDPSTQTGAIIVGVDGRDARAYNSIPKPLSTTEERLHNRELKSKYMEHAERRAIFAAARRGVATEGATMYSPWAPCTPCARAIIDCGISELVVHQFLMSQTPERWMDDVQEGIKMLIEGEVKFTSIRGKLDAEPILFNGRRVYP